ncbi:related to HSV2 - Phosphatidylinositol 3,5-bisphosphate-binding protein [Ustilago trichophora]|uniref:Related to HSV2 - Phosphatidylinositol 3,5-bisphosphate-binding protein n=1 Tax=Ustilago trichophora TaxID=86804 RepID=A0A5C3EIW0_9BASI|nr:related to HSV2 - Phosphatidylinositol 3,5-bisphosphate-binding protein [Ustilago trichophora]
MHLPRHTIESHAAGPLFQHASFCSPDLSSLHSRSLFDSAQMCESGSAGSDQLSQPAVFSCASTSGFLVAQTDPLKLVANRSWSSSQGGLSHAVPIQHTSLLFLVGGGRVPRFAPNKVVLWDEAAEYTPKLPTGAAQDPDSDDDDAGSIASRRASTIFSAGSEFDAYGKTRPEDSEDFNTSERNMRRSSSPSDSLRFSTSSLVHDDDLREDEDGASSSVDPAVSSARERDHMENSMKNSIGTSSLGIGRMEYSYLSGESDREGVASALLEDDHQHMSSSYRSHSIMASSANLADPFNEDGARSTDSSPYSIRRNVVKGSSDPKGLSPAESSMSSDDPTSDTAQPVLSHQRLFSSQAQRQLGAGLVDSVSSMATTATDATAKAPPKILRGREVAELEFSEVVRGIYATSVQAVMPKQKQDGTKGKGRSSVDSSSTRKVEASRICVVLVVLLSSKAIVFELSPPPTARNLQDPPASTAWRIQKKTAVQTYRNLKGLGSVAPFYEDPATRSSTQKSALVAIPGRQKGHVQLLRIDLQSLNTIDVIPVLSNATPSVGAASIIVAHESSIAAITLSPNGHLLATASSKGTLIRVWSNNISGVAGSSTDSGRTATQPTRGTMPGRTGFGAKLIRELRRGTDPATILSISFAPDASLVAAASDKGTIHIFLLADTMSTTHFDLGQQGRSSPSSTSRAANLGRVAAQYLPAGIGSLAGQIPESVLPQYLRSEWSSAQFRIPLKSFGASSRHYSAPSTASDVGIHSTGTASGAPVGTEKSTEGAWAQMRSRISDIRKGEASVDEKIFLCWIVEGTSSSDPLATKGSRQGGQQSRADKARARPPPSSADATGQVSDALPADCDPRDRFRLIAVTTSGGWYKLATTLPRTGAEGDVSGSTVLDMYRRDASSQSRRSGSDNANALKCRLVEFRPMVALLDGWRAS